MTAELHAIALKKTYVAPGFRTRARRAVDDVSLKISSGDAVAIVGVSGCGKSTLARLMVGLERPDAGEVTFGGKSIASFSVDEEKTFRQRVQIVTQDPLAQLDPRLSIRDSLAEPFVIDGVARRNIDDRIRALLDEVQLDADLLQRMPHALSGGQRQRVVIARALAKNPSLLIADEPVTALDVSVRAQMLNLLIDLRMKRQLGLVLITHDFSVAATLTDRVVVMDEGRIVEEGVLKTLVKTPAHDATRRLVAALCDDDPCASTVQNR